MITPVMQNSQPRMSWKPSSWTTSTSPSAWETQ